MFAVIENKQNNKSIIGFINRQQDFLEFVKKEINDDNYIYLTNVQLDEIEDERIYKNNKYLINYNENKLVYIEKIISIDRGYIYNSKIIDINVLCQWKIITNRVDIQKDCYNH